MGIADAVFRGVPYGFVYGTLGIYTGMIVGLVFGLAAWVIDMVNSSENLVSPVTVHCRHR